MKDTAPIEEFIFNFIDKCKWLFFPEQWNNTFLDYSKNEIFALLYIYRKGVSNMTEVAEYLGAPLNTITGLIGRLEKRGVVSRERDIADKRVVSVTMTQKGRDFLATELNTIGFYYNQLMEAITEEEKVLLLKLIGKFLDIISRDLSKNSNSNKQNKGVRRIIIE
jgi:DNA-binding MarR family transcriptional regulator